MSRGHRKVQHIRNDIDQLEAGCPTRQCLHCSKYGHRKKYCLDLKKQVTGDAHVGTSTTTITTTQRRCARGATAQNFQFGHGTAM